MAEFIFKDMLSEAGISGFTVASSATSSETVWNGKGSAVYPEGKIHKLMDYTARGGDVADPWYSDRFDIAYRDIYEGCAALLESLTKG